MANNSTYTTLVQQEVDDTSARATTLISQHVINAYRDVMQKTYRYFISPTELDRTVYQNEDGTYQCQYVPIDSNYVIMTYDRSFYSIEGIFYKAVNASSFTRLTEITMKEYQDHYMNSDAGSPSCWFLRSNLTYQITPTPNEAGTIREILYPVTPDLTGGVVSIIPDRFENVVVMGALYLYKSYEGLPEAVEYRQYYQDALRNMLNELNMQTPPMTPSFFGHRTIDNANNSFSF